MNKLDWNSLSRDIARCAADNRIEAYIVGGAVRDWLLGRPVKDIDLVVAGKSSDFGHLLATHLNGSFVLLDDQRDYCRVVIIDSTNRFELDICPLGESLISELSRRDFTINALAVPVIALRENVDVRSVSIDSYGGLNDIKDRIVRQTRSDAMLEDPLRCLRAARLSCHLDFDIEPMTREAIRSAAPHLSGIAMERIRDEFLSLLSSQHPLHGIISLQDLGVLQVVLPEISAMSEVTQNRIHHLNVWEHTLEALRIAQQIIDGDETGVAPDFLDRIREYGSHNLNGVPISTLIKFAVLLHDVGKPKTLSVGEGGAIHFYHHDVIGEEICNDICGRLRMSRDQSRLLSTVVREHSRPGHLLHADVITPRARRRLIRDLGKFALATFVVCIADRRAARGPLSTDHDMLSYEEFVLSLLQEFLDTQQNPAPPLLTGADVMQELNLSPGPRIGQILGMVEDARVDGIISSRSEALDLARQYLKSNDAKQ